jgi:hypothetical protein
MVHAAAPGAYQALVMAREILEPELAGLAAEAATDEDFALIKDSIDGMRTFLDDGQNFLAENDQPTCPDMPLPRRDVLGGGAGERSERPQDDGERLVAVVHTLRADRRVVRIHGPPPPGRRRRAGA